MSAHLTIDDLHAQGYDTVILAAPDMTGQQFGERLTPAKLEHFRERGVGVSACVVGWDIAQDIGLEVPYAGWHTGWRDFMLVPDLDTLRPAAWLERTAIVLADCVEEDSRELVGIVPRTILRGQIDALRDDGLSAYAATEPEFHVYHEVYDELRARGFRDLKPTTPIHADYAIQKANAWEPFFQRLRNAPDASGLDVELSQGEWGLGQWEIDLTYGDALDMCDRHTIFKLAVKDVAAQAGLSATFMAKPAAGVVGSSCHVHVSLRDGDGRPAFFDEHDPHHTSSALRHVIGGVLEQAPDLMAWYAPTVSAYRRTSSQEFAGNGSTWGYDNRTVSCRVLGDTGESRRLEWRVPGADVNPYLVVAGLIASIRHGIGSEADPGEAIEGNAYGLGIAGYPRHLGDAAERFCSSEFVSQAFGKAVVDQYGPAARYEWDRFLDGVTDWELERYFEHV